MARRASVALRPPHHRPDADRDRRARLARRPAPDHQRRSDRPPVLGTHQQLRDGLHALGHVPRRARRTSTATSARPAPRPQLERRYGITAAGAGYLWHTTDTRFNADDEPNEPNRFGWVVEIDPFNPTSTPVKRTALGRMKHEGAWVQEARDGRVVVYMGDDEQFEYIYRYVSNLPWRKARATGHQPARRRHPLRRQVQRGRHRRVAAAHARQSGARRLVAQRHPDQHARRRRRGRAPRRWTAPSGSTRSPSR